MPLQAVPVTVQRLCVAESSGISRDWKGIKEKSCLPCGCMITHPEIARGDEILRSAYVMDSADENDNKNARVCCDTPGNIARH